MAQDIEIQGGVYIVRRHAKLLASGKKTLIVKGANFSDLVGRSLYAVSKNEVYAIIKLRKPEELSKEDFDKRREEHQITEKENLAWFPYASKRYAYKFDVVKVFDPPMSYKGESDENGTVKNVKIEKIFMAKIPMDELSPKRIQEMGDKEVSSLHDKLHHLYENAPQHNSIEDVLNGHIMCISEMKRRGLGHDAEDELDEKTKRYEDEVLTKLGVLADSPVAQTSAQTSAYQHEEVYKEMGIDIGKLGCIMLDTEPIPNHIPEKFLYSSPNPHSDHTNGFVAGETPHVTLLYGLMESGQTWKKYVEMILGDWMPKSVQVTNVGFFESPKQDEPYYCIVAHLDPTKLIEGHEKLEMLPHIDTFPNYNPHVTIAYIKKDEGIRDIVISIYNKMLAGKELYVKGINFGDGPTQKIEKSGMEIAPYVDHLEKITQENKFYRKILYTSLRSQITVMDIEPMKDVGMENHEVDQFIRIEEGTGQAILNTKTYLITAGDAVLIPAHTDHDILNISKTKDLKFYSIYTPPEHPPKELPQLHKPLEDDLETKESAETNATYPISPSSRSIFSAQHKHYKKKGKPSVRSGASVGTMDYGTSGSSSNS